MLGIVEFHQLHENFGNIGSILLSSRGKMLGTIADAHNNRVTIPIHHKAVQPRPFDDGGAVTCHDVPELRAIPRTFIEVTFFVCLGVFVKKTPPDIILGRKHVVRTNQPSIVNDFLKPGDAYNTIRNVLGMTQVNNSRG